MTDNDSTEQSLAAMCLEYSIRVLATEPASPRVAFGHFDGACRSCLWPWPSWPGLARTPAHVSQGNDPRLTVVLSPRITHVTACPHRVGSLPGLVVDHGFGVVRLLELFHPILERVG